MSRISCDREIRVSVSLRLRRLSVYRGPHSDLHFHFPRPVRLPCDISRRMVTGVTDPLNDDAALLERFARTHDEDAFAALVSRYVDLVYSMSRRELADAAAAEDATQQVFLLL